VPVVSYLAVPDSLSNRPTRSAGAFSSHPAGFPRFTCASRAPDCAASIDASCVFAVWACESRRCRCPGIPPGTSFPLPKKFSSWWVKLPSYCSAPPASIVGQFPGLAKPGAAQMGQICPTKKSQVIDFRTPPPQLVGQIAPPSRLFRVALLAGRVDPRGISGLAAGAWTP